MRIESAHSLGATSAQVLKRLAEVADGFRDEQPRFVHVHADRPFQEPVLVEHPGSPARSPKAGYVRFGPIVTPQDKIPEKSGQVTSIVVTVDLGAGKIIKKTLEGQYDSLFWSMSAIDKFVIPYYVAAADHEYAGSMRSIFADAPEVVMLGHPPDSSTEAIQVVYRVGDTLLEEGLTSFLRRFAADSPTI